MRIAVDAMGGDYAPGAVVEGVVLASKHSRLGFLLVGDQAQLERHLARHGGSESVEIVHAEEVVGMDDPAITPIRKKRRSSIRIAAELVRSGQAQAMLSAGNTGAAMIAAKMVIGTLPGVDRPALATVFPNKTGRTVLLDAGANVDSKLEHLRQFAVMGHCYAQEVVGTPRPRIGLLSIGEEASKGTDLTRQVFRSLGETGLNFVGNVEGRDLFDGSVDVVVCDGFVGNVVLKAAESLATLLSGMIREELSKSWRTQLGGLLARPAFERMRQRTDYREYGAAPLLGIAGGCFIAHGRSNVRAIESAIERAEEFLAADLHTKIAERMATLHREEARWLSSETGGAKR